MEEWTEPNQLSDGSKRHQSCGPGSATLLPPSSSPPMSFSFLCPCKSDTEMSPWHHLWKRDAQIWWHFPIIRTTCSFPFLMGPILTWPAEQRMSEIIAQHPLPDSPEPGGRIPTVAPMELLEQDTPTAKTLSPCAPIISAHDAPRAPGGRIRPPSLPPRSQTSQGGTRFPLFLQHP